MRGATWGSVSTSAPLTTSATALRKLRRNHNPRITSLSAFLHNQDPKATSRVRGRALAPFGGALSEASASFARSSSPVINVNSGLVGGIRAALHVIDEGSQLWHDLPAA